MDVLVMLDTMQGASPSWERGMGLGGGDNTSHMHRCLELFLFPSTIATTRTLYVGVTKYSTMHYH